MLVTGEERGICWPSIQSMHKFKCAAVALYTDFGPFDHYLGEMMAVLQGSLQGVPAYCLGSGAPAFNPRASAYLLAALLKTLPKGHLIVCVVDPGVGTSRRILMMETRSHLLFAPDNGLLSVCRQQYQAQIKELGWRPEYLSSSFHGRDLFAPAVVRYLNDLPLGLRPIDSHTMVGADWPTDLAEIIYIDGYGNLISGVRVGALPENAVVCLRGVTIPWARTFADCAMGESFCYENSSGLLEIAVNCDSAAKRWSASIGEAVVISAPSR
jgi:S-adenosylmethionine hydrolase